MAETEYVDTAGLPKGEPETESHDEDVTLVTTTDKGEKLVPLGSLAAARRDRRDLKAEIERLKEQVAAGSHLAQWVEQYRPQLEAMVAGKAEPVDATASPELVRVAEAAQLYDAAGRPDTTRAKALLDIVGTVVDRRVGEAVRPVAMSIAEQKSLINYQRALQTALPAGLVLDREILAEQWAKVSPDLSQDEEVARHIVQSAVGEQVRRKGLPRAHGEPLFTEGVSHHEGTEATILDRRFARLAGEKPETWKSRIDHIDPSKQVNLEEE